MKSKELMSSDIIFSFLSNMPPLYTFGFKYVNNLSCEGHYSSIILKYFPSINVVLVSRLGLFTFVQNVYTNIQFFREPDVTRIGRYSTDKYFIN